MSNVQTKVLSKSKTTVSHKYAIMMILMIILEMALAVVFAKIWLSWSQIPYVAAGVLFLGLLLTDMLFLSPARKQNYIDKDNLVLNYGYQIKVSIPMRNIISMEETNMQSTVLLVPFGIAKEAKTGVMFLATGPSNHLLITLKQPIRVKSMFRNYGYLDKFVVNFDDPDMAREMVGVSGTNKGPLIDVVTNREKSLNDYTAVVNSPITDKEPTLSITNVSKKYGEVIAVQNLSIDLYPGELFGFLGPNGAGKTTTLKMISGLLKPTGGEISIKNDRSIAYMPEFMVLYERLSGREFLEFLGVLYKRNPNQLRQEMNELLVRFDLGSAADRPIGSYSQGMKRKLSLIATLIKESSILLLDEPTNGLDPNGIVQVKELLRSIAAKGKTVVVSTHILEMAEKLCDRLGIIVGGKLIYVGTVTELRKRMGMDTASLEEIFIKLVQVS